MAARARSRRPRRVPTQVVKCGHAGVDRAWHGQPGADAGVCSQRLPAALGRRGHPVRPGRSNATATTARGSLRLDHHPHLHHSLFMGTTASACPGLFNVCRWTPVAREVPVHFPASGVDYFERLRNASIFYDRVRLARYPINADQKWGCWEAKRLAHPVQTYGLSIRGTGWAADDPRTARRARDRRPRSR